jgi:ABC-type uncharacterized transport system permease subunit
MVFTLQGLIVLFCGRDGAGGRAAAGPAVAPGPWPREAAVDEDADRHLLASTLRVSVPLILCALAGVLCERAGVIDLGLEGKMLATAFAAGAVAREHGLAAAGAAAALAVGRGAVDAARLRLRQPHRRPGGAGHGHHDDGRRLTVVLGIAWFAGRADAAGARRGAAGPWFTGAGRGGGAVPVLGPILAGGCWATTRMVYLAPGAGGAVWWLLYRTRFGLRLRATGENPAMVDAAGVSVKGLRYQALALNGVLCALAGSLPGAGAERRLRAPHDGRPRLHGAGGDDLRQVAPGGRAVGLPAVRLSGRGGHPPAGRGAAGWAAKVPVQAIQALPYVLTVVLLAGFIGRARAGKAWGCPTSRNAT